MENLNNLNLENIEWEDEEAPDLFRSIDIDIGPNVQCNNKVDVMTGEKIPNGKGFYIDGECYLKERLKEYFDKQHVNENSYHWVPHNNRIISWEEYFKIFPGFINTNIHHPPPPRYRTPSPIPHSLGRLRNEINMNPKQPTGPIIGGRNNKKSRKYKSRKYKSRKYKNKIKKRSIKRNPFIKNKK